MLIGAIADDLTGATDLSAMLSRGGMRVLQVVGVPSGRPGWEEADAVVIALKSRTIPAAEAVAHSVAAARVLLSHGARQLIFKYCSTFDSTDDGNIGPVTDALLDLLGETRTIACPAFPANGRSLYQGHLFVGDRLLSDSSMKDHPLTPMRDADLVRVLQRQTARPVSLIPHAVVQDDAALDAAIAGLEGIALVDAISDRDLRAIGRAARDLRLVTGGSGIALGLPDTFGGAGAQAAGRHSAPAPRLTGPGVFLAGSCSAATRRQVAAAEARGVPALRLEATEIAEGRMTVDQVQAFVAAQGGGAYPPLIYSSADPARVALAQDRLGRKAAGEIVETFLAAVAARLLAAGHRRFIVAGGETSGAVVQALGAEVVAIGPEIDPGVPWVFTLGPDPLLLALKSGNFGGDDFFTRAWDQIR